MALHPAFSLKRYIFRRKVLTFLGAKFHIYDENWNLVMFSRQKAFRLREDIRVFADEGMTSELLTIKARQVIDWSATYDVTDATTGETVGSLRRKGWASLVRDSWVLFEPGGREIA